MSISHFPQKVYLNKHLHYHFQNFRTYSIEPGVCDELEEIDSV